MKRKIKRKVFLMGMLMAAGMPVGAWAKGPARPGGVETQPVDLSEPPAASGLLVEEATMERSLTAEVPVPPTRLLASLRNLPGGTSGDAGMRSAYLPPVQSATWRLEWMGRPASEARDPHVEHPKMAASSGVGVALRLDF
jgi:hypothetical protein